MTAQTSVGQVPRYSDICRLGAQSTETSLSLKLRLAVRLSCLTYETDDTIQRWSKGESVVLSESKMSFGANFDKQEAFPLKVVYQGKDTTGDYHKAQWLAGHAGDVLFIAFKGSSSATDFILDSSVSDVVTPSGMRTHSGFYSGVQPELLALLDVCNKNTQFKEIVFCGHSLGGAYSVVAMLELCSHILWERDAKCCEAITFGCPLTVSASRDGAPAHLPSELALVHPPITNVIGNFDVVPRLFALRKETATQLLEEVPGIMNSALHTVVGMAKRAGMFQTEFIVEAVQHLRECFRPLGTYVFGQTIVVGGVRRTTATIIPPHRIDDIFDALQYFPGTDAKEEAKNRVDFVREAIADHSTPGVYWPIVEQLTSEVEGTGKTALCTLVDRLNESVESATIGEKEAVDARHTHAALEAYEPREAMGLAFPNEAVMNELGENDRAAWWRLREEMVRLTVTTAQARDCALAKLSRRDLPRSGDRPSPPPACSVAVAVERLERERGPRETPGGLSRLTSAFSAEASRKPSPYIVNAVEPPVELELSAGTKWKSLVASGEAAALDACEARDSLLIRVGDKCITVVIPEASSSETRVLVVEHSGVLGLFVTEAALRSESTGSWNPFSASRKEKPVMSRVDLRIVVPAVEARYRHLHSLSQKLKLEPDMHTLQLADPTPLGVGVEESDFEKSEHCSICAKVLTSGPIGTQRHHCRACGKSVCGKCSPDQIFLFTYGTTAVRACTPCTKFLGDGTQVRNVQVLE